MKAERINLTTSEGWIPHSTSYQPVSDDTLCMFQYRCGYISKAVDSAAHRDWKQRGWDFDIVAYRVLDE